MEHYFEYDTLRHGARFVAGHAGRPHQGINGYFSSDTIVYQVAINMKGISILLSTVALIGGMVGCAYASYALVVDSTEGGSVTTPGEGSVSAGIEIPSRGSGRGSHQPLSAGAGS